MSIPPTLFWSKVRFGFALIAGVFAVWQVGRNRYYDEEKLVDLALFSLAIGVLAGWLATRWLTGYWPVGVGLVAALVFTFSYLRRLHWPFWPPLGFLCLGAALAWLIVLPSGWAGLTFAGSFYIVVLSGSENVRNFVKGLRAGFYGQRKDASTT